MQFFHQHIDILIGLLLMLSSIVTFIFPPKFGNVFYGVTTKWTLKNETIWDAGQQLFAFAVLIMGSVILLVGTLRLRTAISSFSMLLLLYVLWNLSKFCVHKIIARRYPGV